MTLHCIFCQEPVTSYCSICKTIYHYHNYHLEEITIQISKNIRLHHYLNKDYSSILLKDKAYYRFLSNIPLVPIHVTLDQVKTTALNKINNLLPFI